MRVSIAMQLHACKQRWSRWLRLWLVAAHLPVLTASSRDTSLSKSKEKSRSWLACGATMQEARGMGASRQQPLVGPGMPRATVQLEWMASALVTTQGSP